MKKLVGLTAIVLLFTLAINAQERNENATKKTTLTSEQQATLQSKKMALRLDLDKNQQEAVYKLMKKNDDERQKQLTAFKEKKQHGIELTNDERFQHQNDRLESQLEQKAAMKNILSKDQYEKWEKSNIAKKRNSNRKMGKSKNMKQGRYEGEMKRDRQQRPQRDN